MKIKTSIAIILITIFSLFISGCLPEKKFSGTPVPEVIKDIDNILNNCLSVGFNLKSIVAQSSIKAVDKQEDFTLRCSAQILAKRPDKLHIIATKGFGTEIMNLSMVGNALDIWLPRKDTLYRGVISDLNEADMNFHPQDIVEQILFPSRSFLDNKWNKVFEDEENVLIEAKQDELGRHLLTISKKTGLLTRRQLFNNTDQCIIDVSFSKYRRLKKLDNKFYPHKFHLNFPEEGKDLYIVLRNISVNEELKPTDFYLVVPKDKKISVKPLKPSDPDSKRKDMLHELEASQE